MITVDIQRFSTHLAAIYANLAKPVLDVALYNYQLSQNVGAEGLAILTGLVQTSASLRKLPCSGKFDMTDNTIIVRFLNLPFEKYAAEEARLSGQLWHSHSRAPAHTPFVTAFCQSGSCHGRIGSGRSANTLSCITATVPLSW